MSLITHLNYFFSYPPDTASLTHSRLLPPPTSLPHRAAPLHPRFTMLSATGESCRQPPPPPRPPCRAAAMHVEGPRTPTTLVSNDLERSKKLPTPDEG
jgi:hypothetical protein